MLVASHTTLPAFPDPPAAPRRARAQQPQLLHSHVFSAQRVHQHFAEALIAPPALLISEEHPVLASPGAPLREKLLAAQLAHLASQHHRSEHNRLKFGVKGSPVPYVPLSVQLPEHVMQLQAQQEVSCGRQAWWLSDRRRNSVSRNGPSPSAKTVADSGGIQENLADALPGDASRVLPVGVSTPPARLQQEISAAIEAPLNTMPFTVVGQITKTSETHPINISMVVPYELLPVLSSQLQPAPPPSPCMFHVPPRYYLDSVTSVPIPGAHTLNPPSNPVHYPLPNSNSMFAPAIRPQNRQSSGFHPPSIVWSQPAGFDLLRNALCDVDNAGPLKSRSSTFSGSLQHSDRDDADVPAPPPFFVPSQAPQLPPSPGRLMMDSPPIPIPNPILTDAVDWQEANPLHEKALRLGSGFPQPPNPPSSPTGVIRRPRHERASSAPPMLAFPPPRSPHRKSLGGTEASNGNGHVKLSIPRHRSHPEVVSKVFPPPGIPAFVLEDTGKYAKTVDVPDSVSELQQAAEDTSEPRSYFETSLTQNPAFLKRSDERGQMLPPPLPTLLPWSNGFSHSPCSCGTIPSDAHPVIPKLGNLFLSSCPGKKVRLSGPVRGRGAICRDLRADLTRVKDLGVGCIVCCLDDTELSFLGASWPEYSSIANDLGLDVLRLPTPEGLAPLAPAALDEHLTRLIRAYTLRGVPVLVHCRGGVGRAGLIACCWLLKLGLCGWKDPALCARTHVPHAPVSAVGAPGALEVAPSTSTPTPAPALFAQAAAHGAGVCLATVQLVERAIAVVRRRRSLKAVETYEQVKFLVDFVEYLDAKAKSAPTPLCDVE